MDQYQLPLFFVDVHARAVVSPWDAPTRTRICTSIRVVAHQRATLSTMFVYAYTIRVCVYIYCFPVTSMCDVMYEHTRGFAQLEPLHARSFPR